MKFYLAIFFSILFSFAAIAQVEKIVEAELIVEIGRNETELAVVQKAKNEVRIKALEKAFGVFISESNVLRTQSETLVKQNFISVSSALVNGEWIKTIEEKISFINDSNSRSVKVYVKGLGRELKRLKFEPKVEILNCLSEKCVTTEFKNGEQLFMKMRSPKSVYVSIFCDDGAKSQRLLPYSNSEMDFSQAVKADVDYTFFSKSKSGNAAEEIELFTNSDLEINKIYILFSEEKLSKPNLKNDHRALELNSIMPKSLESAEFYDWLQQIRLTNRNIQVNEIDILIKK